MYRPLLITIGFACSFFIASAQSYLDGFIVTNSNDTLQGQLVFKEEELAQEKVSFRSGQDASVTYFTAGDIKGYGYKGGDTFYSYTVAISKNPVDLKNASDKSIPPVIEKVFLRLMHKGIETVQRGTIC